MKPDWKDAPEWAQWLAVTGDGVWIWFENEPQLFSGKYWKPNEVGGHLVTAGANLPCKEPRP